MNADEDDLVMGEPADDFEDMLGILRGEPGGRFVEQEHIGKADHVESDVEPLSLTS